MAVNTVQIGNKSVIIVDCSNLGKLNKSQIIITLEQGTDAISKCNLKSAYVITNVTQTGFDSDIRDAFKTYASKNTPYVKESIIVGLAGIQKVIFSTLKALTKREFILVETMEEATQVISKL